MNIMKSQVSAPLKAFFVTLLISIVVTSAVPESEGTGAGLPEGAGREVVSQMCGSSCHQIDEVIQIRASADRWWQIVDDMVARGATGSDEEVETVVYYLTSHFGLLVHMNQATAEEITASLFLTAEDAQAILDYREAHGEFKTWEDLLKVPGIDLDALREVKDNITFE